MVVVPISMRFVPCLENQSPFNTSHDHIIQNAWRHLWKWAVAHRREIKSRSEKVTTPWYKKKLETLAVNLWENRYLLFFAPSE